MDQEVKHWMEKIEKSKNGTVDLSRDEDLSIALMNLVSLEEHFFFTAMKTESQHYLDMMQSVRKMRQTFLQKIVKNPKGEEWCISKHLLAASMRLYEVGTKEFAKGNKKEANTFFTSAFDTYSLFFAINLDMVKPQKLVRDEKLSREQQKMSKFSQVVKKLVDCCKEW